MILSIAEVFLKLSEETTDWEVIFSSIADTEGHETNFALLLGWHIKKLES